MENILQSAAKIVFIMMAITVCVAFLFLVFTGKVILEPKDFMTLAGMAFGFFFAYKGDVDKPYAGK